VKATAANFKLLQTLGEGEKYQGMHIKSKPKLEKNAKTISKFQLHYASLEWDWDKIAEVPGGKEMAGVMKKIMGEGMNIWFGTDGKVFVQLIAKDWDNAKKYLDAYLDGTSTVGKQKAFLDARKQLPEETTSLSLLDGPVAVKAMVELGFAAMKEATGGLIPPFPLPEIKPPKPGLSYLGGAVTLKPKSGGFDFWVPASTIQEVKKMIVDPIMKQLGGVGAQ